MLRVATCGFGCGGSSTVAPHVDCVLGQWKQLCGKLVCGVVKLVL